MPFLANIAGYLYAHWRQCVIVLAGVAAAVLILIGVLWGRSCYVNYKQDQVTQDLTNSNKKIDAAKDQTAVLEQEKEQRKQEVLNAATNSNNALDAVNIARHIDSNKLNSNLAVVKSRFCLDYPGDELCL